MGFESAPNPYEGLDTLSVDELKNKVGELNLDQLTWLKAKLEQDKEANSKDMDDPQFKDYEMIGKEGTGPILVNGKTLEQLSLANSEISLKLEAVEDAMKKESKTGMDVS